VIEKYTGFDFLSAFPKTKTWQQELMKIQALARSVPEDFEKAFVEFYLNDQTYLGRLMGEQAA
jgi:glutathione S-transferase